LENKTSQATGALMWSIAAASFMTIIKLAAAFLTQSMSIMASALDSLTDVGSSVVNLIAVRKAAKPPDEEHAYGHEKIESLASLFQSIFIGLSGAAVLIESVKRLIFGSSLNVVPVGIIVMIISILITFCLVMRLRTVYKKNGSLILGTEKIHYTMDFLTGSGTLLALVLVQFTHWIVWDLIVSVAITLYIFCTAFKILRSAINELLDQSLPPSAKREIHQLIRNHNPSIIGLHNFRSRRVRDKIFLDFHIEIRGEDDFKRAHLMTESLIQKIKQRYPSADITVHFDPEGEA
jgi:ferrous-iron efflux pump FieF